MSKRGWIIVLIITVLAIVVWILLDVILAKPNTGIDQKTQKLITPVNPNFDKSTLEKVENVYIPNTQSFSQKFPIPSVIELSPIIPSPEASSSAFTTPKTEETPILVSTSSATKRIEF